MGIPGVSKRKTRNLYQINIQDHDHNEDMETNDALEGLGYTDGYSIPRLAPASTFPGFRGRRESDQSPQVPE
jgi:hypothetical protein